MSKFKKGDRVKIIKESRGHWKGVGLIGEVVKDDGTCYLPYKVEFSDGGKTEEGRTYGYYDEDDIKLVLPDRKLKVGDKVEFITNNKHVPTYYTQDDGIPLSLIVHGGISLGDAYKKNKAKIVNKHKEYFIVEYVCGDGRTVRLGFKAESLKLIKSNNETPTHIILCDNVYHIAYGRKDRDKKIKELVDDKDIDNNDITVFDIKNESKIKCEVKYLFFKKHHIVKKK